MNSKYESISDDDLFGSGCDSLDLNSLISSDVSEPITGNAANTMTLQNQDESKNRSSNVKSQQQVLCPMPGSSRSTEDAFHPVYEPVPIHGPSPSRREPTDTGARAKVLKNKENKSKNSTKRAQIVKNGENKVIPPQFRPCDRTSVWEPVLQVKQYGADDDETSLLKPVNASRQKRQNKNRNAPKSKSAPLMSTSSVSSDNDFLSLDSIPLPAHLNPKDVKHHVYIKRINNVQNGIVPQNGEQKIPHSSHRENKNDNALSVNTIQPSNIYSIHNNLWEGQRKVKKQSNEDNISVHFSPSNNQAVHVVNNDIEMDMESQQSGFNIPNPRHLSGANSGSRLDNPIVLQYETEAQNQHALRMENIPCNTQPATCDNVHALNFDSTSSSVPNALVDEFSDSLPSNMSSNILFGDGLNNDFLFAQQLQRKYDRENEEIQRNRQFNVPTNVHTFSEQPLNRQRNLITQPSPSENIEPSEDANIPVNESLNTLDFVTAFHSFDDGLNNGRGSVYAPGDIENPSQHSEPIVIPFENQRDTNEAEHDEQTERVSEPIVVTIPYDRIQNDELYPETVSVRGNIHIPQNEDYAISNIRQPSCVESAGNLLARGSRSPRQQDGQTDAELARLLQEQQDEELARQLQEEDERRSHSPFMGRNNARTIPHVRHRHSEPLRQRFSDTWNRRPLVVPIGALNNNVADSQSRRPYTSSERPLVTGSGNEFSYLDNVHSRPLHEGYDIPPGPDYYYRIENDPDYMLDEYGEDRLISINRDPQLLASLLMTRDPEMLIPPDVDLNDYEALWELAENLGEVRRVGMDQNDISLLPVHYHEAKSKENTSDDGIDCLVCLSEFKTGEELKTLPCCHVYHVHCIDEWLKRNAICPVCRRSAKQGENQQLD